MNVTRMSALEIYGNQADIVCECAGKDKDGYFVGVIRRGLGHDGKWILSAGFDLKTKEEVVSYMESLRDDIIDFVKKDLDDKDSETSRLLQDDSIQTALEIAEMAQKDIS